MKNLFLAVILIPLLTLAPVTYAQNNETNFISSETFNQAKNTSIGLVDQAPDALKGAYNQAKNTSIGLVDQAPDALKGAYNQAKNTSIGLVDQAPDALKGAYNQAKNTSIGLVDQATNLIKNDTNSSKLLNQLEADVENLINEFSSFFSR
jgi:cbb3-type cytochrome oxidase subunit 3